MGDKQALVPRLRFPEFRKDGEWGNIPLGECLDYLQPTKYLVSNTDYDNRYPTPVLTAGKTFILGYTNETTGIFEKGLPVIIFDDFTTASKFVDFPFKAKSSAMKILLAKESANIKFVFESMQMIKYEVGVHERHWISIFSKLTVPRPKHFEEQQKIADCLSSLDALIAAQAKKIDALKTQKKALMQQLVPREGETIPSLRFPEFRNAGEWKLLALGEKVDLLSGFPFKSSEISDDPSGAPLMRGINITEGFIRHSTDIDRFFLGETSLYEKYLLKVNDLVIGMDGSKVGKNSALVTESDRDSLLIQRVARLRTKCQATIQFIFQHIHSSKFHSYVDRINTSSGIPHISAKQINEFQICFPPAEEQQTIVDCLSSLDALIAEQAGKIYALKAHKKGLMQQLFPNPGAFL